MAAEPAELDWPLKIRPRSITGTFGEPRSAHLHTGLDIRTQGREGVPVHAPAAGEISRLRCSPEGYGKALYLRLHDGRTVVFAHLSAFSDPLQGLITRAQARSRSYTQDLNLAQTIPVERGDLIALSGATGTGAPHLHAEIRGADGRPRDPLLNGLNTDDNVAPQVLGIRLVPLSPRSRLGGRARSVEIRHGDRVEAVGPIGVRVRLRDRTQHARFGLLPAGVRLIVDDSARFARGDEASDFGVPLGAVFDTEADGARRWIQLFDRAALAGDFDAAGVIDLERGGERSVVVQTEDAAGNEARARFTLAAVDPAAAPGRGDGSFGRLDDSVEYHLGEAVVELRLADGVAPPQGAVVVAEDLWAASVAAFAPWARERADWWGLAGGEKLDPDAFATWPLRLDPAALGRGGVLELRERIAPDPLPDGCELLAPAVEMRGLGILFQDELALWVQQDVEVDGKASVFHYDWRGKWRHAGGGDARVGGLRSEGTVAWLLDRRPPAMGDWRLEDGSTLVSGASIGARDSRAAEGRTLPRWPSVVLGVFEDGAGIEPGDIRATIDGEPFPARFDPEDGFVAFDFFVEPQPGVHEFVVELRDRVGNPGRSSLRVELTP